MIGLLGRLISLLRLWVLLGEFGNEVCFSLKKHPMVDSPAGGDMTLRRLLDLSSISSFILLAYHTPCRCIKYATKHQYGPCVSSTVWYMVYLDPPWGANLKLKQLKIRLPGRRDVDAQGIKVKSLLFSCQPLEAGCKNSWVGGAVGVVVVGR